MGAGYGLLRGLRVRRNSTRSAADMENLEARVDTIHVEVARLANQAEQLQSRLDEMITKDELSQTLDRVFGPLERGIDARFEHQARSVEALRTMVGQTDELLQRVLDGLESVRAESGAEYAEPSRQWNLTRAGG